MEPAVALPAALALGFLGSGHCVLMCGGICCALSGAGGASRPVPALAGAAHAGRITSYAGIGALCGGLGSVLLEHLPGSAGWPIASVLSAAVLVVIGLSVGGWWRALDRLERGAARLWRVLAPATRALLPVRRPGSALVLGALWGLVPCGLVYAAAGMAMLAGSAAAGAATMLAFGLGTVPALVAAALGAQAVSRLAGARSRRTAGGCLVAAGFVTLLAPLLAPVIMAG